MVGEELIISVNLGTSNLKGAVFNLNGAKIAYEECFKNQGSLYSR